MKLLTSPASPYVRKARVILLEAGTREVQEVEVSTTAFATDEQVKAANPLGKIPALIMDDGQALFDSRVITRFLDSHFGTGLYPSTSLWAVLRLEATGDGILDCALAMTYELRFRPEEKRFPEWLDAQWAKISSALDYLESDLDAQLGGDLNIGQIAVGCALGYLDLRHDARGWRNTHPKLAAWFAAFSQRPSMTATAPKG